MKNRYSGKNGSRKYKILKTAEKIVIYSAVTLIVLNFLLGLSKIEGNSMEPTLHDGQVVLCLKISTDYDVGDIVSVKMPSNERIVKRIAAISGDTVEMKNGIVYVNGQKRTDEILESDSTDDCSFTLTEGQVYLLGDNEKVSIDSRVFGPISKTQITGLVLNNNQ